MTTDEKVVKLAKSMHTRTVERVGGQPAWERMTQDVQIEAYATTAWLLTYARWEEGMSKVTMEDIALAYALLTT